MLAIMGLIIIVAMILFIFTKKMSASSCFIILPIIGALFCGFSVGEIGEMVGKGLSSVMKMATLFVFSVMFFDLMNDVGIFDALIGKLCKWAKNKVISLVIVVYLVAYLAAFAGDSPTTYIITYTAMLPIALGLGMSKKSVLIPTCLALGFMNMLPWGGTVTRCAAVLGIDATELFKSLLPSIIFGSIVGLGVCILVGYNEIRHGAGKAVDGTQSVSLRVVQLSAEELAELKRPKLIAVNWILVIAVIAIAMFSGLPSYLPFMIGTVVAFHINYPDMPTQKKLWEVHAPDFSNVVATTLAAAVLVGILGNSGMIAAMAEVLVKILPESLAAHFHILIALATPVLTMGVAADPYYYALLPVVVETVGAFGVPGSSAAYAMVIIHTMLASVSPVVPSMYMGLACADIDLGEQIKSCMPSLLITGILMVLFGIFTGVIVF